MAVNQRDNRAGGRGTQVIFRGDQKMPVGLRGSVNAGPILAVVRCQDDQTAALLRMTGPGVGEDIFGETPGCRCATGVRHSAEYVFSERNPPKRPVL